MIWPKFILMQYNSLYRAILLRRNHFLRDIEMFAFPRLIFPQVNLNVNLLLTIARDSDAMKHTAMQASRLISIAERRLRRFDTSEIHSVNMPFF